MRDCSNAEIRDLLPDLLHERLDADSRAAVLAHLEVCAECRAEFALLKKVRSALHGATSVDVRAVAQAVATRSGTDFAGARERRSARWMDWRVAAVIAIVVAGGASLAAIYGSHLGPTVPDSARRVAVAPISSGSATSSTRDSAAATQPTAGRKSVSSAAPTPVRHTAHEEAELSMGGGTAELSESDLRALLADIEHIDALPVTEPEPMTVRVSVPGGGSSE